MATRSEPAFKEPRIKFEKSKARELLYDDLIDETIPLDAVEGEDLTDLYNSRDEYKLYDPSKWKKRVESCRKTIKGRKERASNDLLAYQHIKNNHPPVLQTHQGHMQWQGSEAQFFLLIDIEADLHKNQTKKALFESRPEYYENFDLKTFRDKLDQEIRTAKYLHTLDVKGKSYKAS